MKIKITVSRIDQYKAAKFRTFSTPQDMYVEGDNLEFRAKGTLLEVFDKTNKVGYTTDLAFATAITTLDAVQNATSLQWILT